MLTLAGRSREHVRGARRAIGRSTTAVARAVLSALLVNAISVPSAAMPAIDPQTPGMAADAARLIRVGSPPMARHAASIYREAGLGLPMPVVSHCTEGAMANEQRNMELMQTLDDAWNAQNMDVFRQRHRPDVVVTWPGKPPTHGVQDHVQESLDFFRAFPDQKLDNRPYRVFFADGDWTCSIARFRGTFSGPLRGADGTDVAPTGRKFDVQFCTVARWDEDGQIIEENLFYDLVSFMQQIGLG